MPSKQEVLKALKAVKDPEIGESIVDMGLVYDVKVVKDSVKIRMTYTSMFCPMAGFIDADIRKKVRKIKGVKKVDIDVVFDPPWSPERMSPELRAEMGI
ncbi:aromatic ring hydroxylase [Candidatus Micrarchaeota archaeon RBG_16_49_10]|nr:MAG: aromatic ring hydroxylase [Candidatus Micrarchaeota archaeon RBG_16_49_10]